MAPALIHFLASVYSVPVSALKCHLHAYTPTVARAVFHQLFINAVIWQLFYFSQSSSRLPIAPSLRSFLNRSKRMASTDASNLKGVTPTQQDAPKHETQATTTPNYPDPALASLEFTESYCKPRILSLIANVRSRISPQ